VTEFVVDECRSCQAKVIWAVTTRARPMPVDAEPVPDGNIRLEHRGEGTTPLARVLTTTQRFGLTSLRKSHFASCRDSDTWRQRPGNHRG